MRGLFSAILECPLERSPQADPESSEISSPRDRNNDGREWDPRSLVAFAIGVRSKRDTNSLLVMGPQIPDCLRDWRPFNK